MIFGDNPNCHYGDHDWNGTGICQSCGKRLRCGCGRFVAENDLERHVRDDCPQTLAFLVDERRKIEATFG
jgi:hypothetical protein